MKWPESLTIIRHVTSSYNALKQEKESDPEYQEFKKAYDRRREDPETARRLASLLIANKKHILNTGDYNTQPAPGAVEQQAVPTGEKLKTIISKPDVIFVSPYDRTKATLGGLCLGWPELADVKTVEDERLREQDHGLALLYNDWRIFNVVHPEQEALRDLQGPYWYMYPQGENVPMVRERARSITNAIVRDFAEHNVLIVSHHLMKLSMRANFERLDAEQFQYLDTHEKPINCGATIYRGNPDAGSDGHLELDEYNLKLY